METWLYLVQTACADPAREKEFQDWYDNVHFPDILKAPGFISATRYVIKEPTEGQGKYLAIYEIETEDIEKTMGTFGGIVQELREKGRMSPLSKVISRTLWRQLAPAKKK